MFDQVLNAPLRPVIINYHIPYLPACLCYLHITLAARRQLQTRHPPPYLLGVRNKVSQFANCEPLLDNSKSKLLKKIVKQLFLMINFLFLIFFFHSELLYLLCLIVVQARKYITHISSLIFHRIAQNLVRTNISQSLWLRM